MAAQNHVMGSNAPQALLRKQGADHVVWKTLVRSPHMFLSDSVSFSCAAPGCKLHGRMKARCVRNKKMVHRILKEWWRGGALLFFFGDRGLLTGAFSCAFVGCWRLLHVVFTSAL